MRKRSKKKTKKNPLTCSNDKKDQEKTSIDLY